MKFVSLSYVRSNGFHDPATWLERIKPYGKVLEALGKKQDVISIEQIDFEGAYQSNGVEYKFIRSKSNKLPTSLHRLVKKLNPDVVIVHGLSFPIQVVQLRKTLGENVIVLVQHHADKIPVGWRRWAQKIADRNVNGYLFSSGVMAEEWVGKKLIADRRKIKEAMVGASTFLQIDKAVARSITKANGNPIFLFVGRVDANKDPFTLIKAFAEFTKKHSSASLYLIIQNPEKISDLEELIIRAHGQKNIFLVGKVPHVEMQNWFNSADFIISASHAEAFGMAVVEGMSCGCYPIITNIPSFRKITDNGTCGILFEPGNVGQLTASLEKAAQLNLDVERKKVVSHYNAQLSAEAIAEQIYKAATSL
jgi:glycosyltransferase involved in cell wall biosynthesis